MSRNRNRRAPRGGPPPPPPPSRAPVPAPPPPAPAPVVDEVDDIDEIAADLASIDAADAELVLRRAIQLSDDSLVVASDRFPINSLEQVAAELHVPIVAVADALAEYRAGAIDQPELSASGERRDPRRSLLDRLIGPGSVKVRHRTGLSDDVAVEHLSSWLKRRHRLRIRVNPEGTVVGVRRRGVVPVVMRSVRSATGSAGLAGAKEVRAAAVTAGDNTSLCLVVDVSDHRAQSVVAGSAVAAGGTLVVGVVAAATAPVTLVGVPVAVGVGWITSRFSHRHRLRRITQEAEITADHVAAGATPPRLTSDVAARLSSKRRRT